MTDDLIARLEAATEGSRELDGAIYETVTGVRITGPRDKEWLVVPFYTTSLDAALTLVPEGLCWGLNTHPEDEIFNPGGAQAFVSDMLEDGIYAHADAATPALALCIAALKARCA